METSSSKDNFDIDLSDELQSSCENNGDDVEESSNSSAQSSVECKDLRVSTSDETSETQCKIKVGTGFKGPVDITVHLETIEYVSNKPNTRSRKESRTLQGSSNFPDKTIENDASPVYTFRREGNSFKDESQSRKVSTKDDLVLSYREDKTAENATSTDGSLPIRTLTAEMSGYTPVTSTSDGLGREEMEMAANKQSPRCTHKDDLSESASEEPSKTNQPGEKMDVNKFSGDDKITEPPSDKCYIPKLPKVPKLLERMLKDESFESIFEEPELKTAKPSSEEEKESGKISQIKDTPSPEILEKKTISTSLRDSVFSARKSFSVSASKESKLKRQVSWKVPVADGSDANVSPEKVIQQTSPSSPTSSQFTILKSQELNTSSSDKPITGKLKLLGNLEEAIINKETTVDWKKKPPEDGNPASDITLKSSDFIERRLKKIRKSQKDQSDSAKESVGDQIDKAQSSRSESLSRSSALKNSENIPPDFSKRRKSTQSESFGKSSDDLTKVPKSSEEVTASFTKLAEETQFFKKTKDSSCLNSQISKRSERCKCQKSNETPNTELENSSLRKSSQKGRGSTKSDVTEVTVKNEEPLTLFPSSPVSASERHHSGKAPQCNFTSDKSPECKGKCSKSSDVSKKTMAASKYLLEKTSNSLKKALKLKEATLENLKTDLRRDSLDAIPPTIIDIGGKEIKNELVNQIGLQKKSSRSKISSIIDQTSSGAFKPTQKPKNHLLVENQNASSSKHKSQFSKDHSKVSKSDAEVKSVAPRERKNLISSSKCQHKKYLVSKASAELSAHLRKPLPGLAETTELSESISDSAPSSSESSPSSPAKKMFQVCGAIIEICKQAAEDLARRNSSKLKKMKRSKEKTKSSLGASRNSDKGRKSSINSSASTKSDNRHLKTSLDFLKNAPKPHKLSFSLEKDSNSKQTFTPGKSKSYETHNPFQFSKKFQESAHSSSESFSPPRKCARPISPSSTYTTETNEFPIEQGESDEQVDVYSQIMTFVRKKLSPEKLVSSKERKESTNTMKNQFPFKTENIKIRPGLMYGKEVALNSSSSDRIEKLLDHTSDARQDPVPPQLIKGERGLSPLSQDTHSDEEALKLTSIDLNAESDIPILKNIIFSRQLPGFTPSLVSESHRNSTANATSDSTESRAKQLNIATALGYDYQGPFKSVNRPRLASSNYRGDSTKQHIFFPNMLENMTGEGQSASNESSEVPLMDKNVLEVHNVIADFWKNTPEFGSYRQYGKSQSIRPPSLRMSTPQFLATSPEKHVTKISALLKSTELMAKSAGSSTTEKYEPEESCQAHMCNFHSSKSPQFSTKGLNALQYQLIQNLSSPHRTTIHPIFTEGTSKVSPNSMDLPKGLKFLQTLSRLGEMATSRTKNDSEYSKYLSDIFSLISEICKKSCACLDDKEPEETKFQSSQMVSAQGIRKEKFVVSPKKEVDYHHQSHIISGLTTAKISSDKIDSPDSALKRPSVISKSQQANRFQSLAMPLETEGILQPFNMNTMEYPQRIMDSSSRAAASISMDPAEISSAVAEIAANFLVRDTESSQTVSEIHTAMSGIRKIPGLATKKVTELPNAIKASRKSKIKSKMISTYSEQGESSQEIENFPTDISRPPDDLVLQSLLLEETAQETESCSSKFCAVCTLISNICGLSHCLKALQKETNIFGVGKTMLEGSPEKVTVLPDRSSEEPGVVVGIVKESASLICNTSTAPVHIVTFPKNSTRSNERMPSWVPEALSSNRSIAPVCQSDDSETVSIMDVPGKPSKRHRTLVPLKKSFPIADAFAEGQMESSSDGKEVEDSAVNLENELVSSDKGDNDPAYSGVTKVYPVRVTIIPQPTERSFTTQFSNILTEETTAIAETLENETESSELPKNFSDSIQTISSYKRKNTETSGEHKDLSKISGSALIKPNLKYAMKNLASSLSAEMNTKSEDSMQDVFELINKKYQRPSKEILNSFKCLTSDKCSQTADKCMICRMKEITSVIEKTEKSTEQDVSFMFNSMDEWSRPYLRVRPTPNIMKLMSIGDNEIDPSQELESTQQPPKPWFNLCYTSANEVNSLPSKESSPTLENISDCADEFEIVSPPKGKLHPRPVDAHCTGRSRNTSKPAFSQQIRPVTFRKSLSGEKRISDGNQEIIILENLAKPSSKSQRQSFTSDITELSGSRKQQSHFLHTHLDQNSLSGDQKSSAMEISESQSSHSQKSSDKELRNERTQKSRNLSKRKSSQRRRSSKRKQSQEKSERTASGRRRKSSGPVPSSRSEKKSCKSSSTTVQAIPCCPTGEQSGSQIDNPCCPGTVTTECTEKCIVVTTNLMCVPCSKGPCCQKDKPCDQPCDKPKTPEEVSSPEIVDEPELHISMDGKVSSLVVERKTEAKSREFASDGKIPSLPPVIFSSDSPTPPSPPPPPPPPPPEVSDKKVQFSGPPVERKTSSIITISKGSSFAPKSIMLGGARTTSKSDSSCPDMSESSSEPPCQRSLGVSSCPSQVQQPPCCPPKEVIYIIQPPITGSCPPSCCCQPSGSSSSGGYKGSSGSCKGSSGSCKGSSGSCKGGNGSCKGGKTKPRRPTSLFSSESSSEQICSPKITKLPLKKSVTTLDGKVPSFPQKQCRQDKQCKQDKTSDGHIPTMQIDICSAREPAFQTESVDGRSADRHAVEYLFPVCLSEGVSVSSCPISKAPPQSFNKVCHVCEPDVKQPPVREMFPVYREPLQSDRIKPSSSIKPSSQESCKLTCTTCSHQSQSSQIDSTVCEGSISRQGSDKATTLESSTGASSSLMEVSSSMKSTSANTYSTDRKSTIPGTCSTTKYPSCQDSLILKTRSSSRQPSFPESSTTKTFSSVCSQDSSILTTCSSGKPQDSSILSTCSSRRPKDSSTLKTCSSRRPKDSSTLKTCSSGHPQDSSISKTLTSSRYPSIPESSTRKTFFPGRSQDSSISKTFSERPPTLQDSAEAFTSGINSPFPDSTSASSYPTSRQSTKHSHAPGSIIASTDSYPVVSSTSKTSTKMESSYLSSRLDSTGRTSLDSSVTGSGIAERNPTLRSSYSAEEDDDEDRIKFSENEESTKREPSRVSSNPHSDVKEPVQKSSTNSLHNEQEVTQTQEWLTNTAKARARKNYRIRMLPR